MEKPEGYQDTRAAALLRIWYCSIYCCQDRKKPMVYPKKFL